MLLLFNESDALSYQSIKDQLGVNDDKELQRTLLSLSVGKVRRKKQRCTLPSFVLKCGELCGGFAV